ncbi:BolA [[Actinobacillus] muris]|uniref:BolA n=1 Tax=Muribacter muris TaxID=67855 RepID=A0A0J5S258_9PAST|nr:BolA/IbaG family iron-sulfur metabolism protein [Muribacter muris]KMK50907.1 BolA [[Actinobacillus] muris] [Muribacter muris]
MFVEKCIIEKLTEKFAPQVLIIENESHKHSSGRGAESHFKVILVSDYFELLRAVARHQAVYQTLSVELENGVHALALHLYTPNEWRERGENAPPSPNCVGVGQ